MCFSATASFTAGAALLVAGTVTTRFVRQPGEIPYAFIPVLFGIQQLIEGSLWLTFPDKAPLLNTFLTYAYSVFSHVLWPIYVPIAVYLLETVAWRRKALLVTATGGALVGFYLLYNLIRLPIIATAAEGHIDYVSPHFYIPVVMALYVLGTCVSPLLSSHRWVRWFGATAILSFIAAGAFYVTWFISVWCFFAAIMSVMVLMFFLRRDTVVNGLRDQ
ncbi:MAG: DUF6629 family protein [Parasphingorhabdus sp.]|uniref:DUF6629 family protein n=1 Tax=Parasphingorhabdus sp. TaxID=2709688 RepID=UPI0030031482|tara:strand:- start:1355 stop:2008 length:654 start_codon:yes stop_codon:yes gene_type:complete